MRSPFLTYAIAIAALVAALVLRGLLDPFLGNSMALTTVYAAVAIAVWIGGYRPALGRGCDARLPRLSLSLPGTQGRLFDLSTAKDLVGLIAYLFTCSLIIAIGAAMRAAQRRANERGELLHASLAERQKFVTLVENSTDFIGIATSQGVPFYVNRAGLELVGLESLEQAAAHPCATFSSPKTSPDHGGVLPLRDRQGPRRGRGPVPALQDRGGPMDGLQGPDADGCHRAAAALPR